MGRFIKSFRRGETTYKCHCCKKLTRNTGGDERASALCLDCFELASIENHLLDNGELGDYEQEARQRFDARPELVQHFKEIWDAINNGGKRV